MSLVAFETALQGFGKSLKSLDLMFFTFDPNYVYQVVNWLKITRNLEILKLELSNMNVVFPISADYSDELPVLDRLKKTSLEINLYDVAVARFIKEFPIMAPNVQDLNVSRSFSEPIPQAERAILEMIRFYGPNLKTLKYHISSSELFFDFVKIDLPVLEELEFESNMITDNFCILVDSLKKGNLKILKLNDDNSFDDVINGDAGKCNLLDELPSLEKLSIALEAFGYLIKGEKSLDNLKSLELRGRLCYAEALQPLKQMFMRHIFDMVQFTRLQSLEIERCLFSRDILNLIDKSAPNLEKLIIDGAYMGDDIDTVREKRENFKNVKFLKVNEKPVYHII